MDGEDCGFFSFEVELSHKDSSQGWMNLVNLSAAFMEFPPFAYHIIRFKQILKSLEYVLHDVREKLWVTNLMNPYYIFVEI